MPMARGMQGSVPQRVPPKRTKHSGDLGREERYPDSTSSSQEIHVRGFFMGWQAHFARGVMLTRGCSALGFKVSAISHLGLVGQAEARRERGSAGHGQRQRVNCEERRACERHLTAGSTYTTGPV